MNQEEYYRKFRDALFWLEHANRHYYSSQIIYQHLEPLMKLDSIDSEEDNSHFIALWQSYFLLMSLAFENLLKGLIISIEPDLEDIDDYKTKYTFSYNHDLIKMFDRNFRKLSQEENELILRLQTYLSWMSKYPIPLKSRMLEYSKKRLRFSDNECLISLYQEVEFNLKDNIDKDPIRHWKSIGMINEQLSVSPKKPVPGPGRPSDSKKGNRTLLL